jgi:CMP-N,N'-diacetyllegionaminic acid synthase
VPTPSAAVASPVAAVIAARGGSKGIPGKNLAELCGRPLLAWSIDHARAAEGVDTVWVSSDDEEILAVAEGHGAHPIRRPAELAGDAAPSESAWLHALDAIEEEAGRVGLLCALQATSPLREPSDLERGLADIVEQGADAVFSAALLDDFLVWERAGDGTMRALNYDPERRGRRQDRAPQYVENGSFYLVRPEILRSTGNRLGGRVGLTLMDFWKSFEIDEPADLDLCAALMRLHGLDERAAG